MHTRISPVEPSKLLIPCEFVLGAGRGSFSYFPFTYLVRVSKWQLHMVQVQVCTAAQSRDAIDVKAVRIRPV